MSHDLVLQTKIGREETLEKFLHTIGKKGTIKDPCAVRLRRVNREEFEARWAQKARALQIDANWIEPGLKLKNFKLFATDMDSTFLNLETLDEMASFVGKGEEVAHITELSMQGKIKPNPGAEKLVAAFKAAGIPMLLVSGGFSCVTEVVKERYGFTHVISNELEIVDGKLTGRVTGPFGTPIIDGRGKISYVSAYALQHGIELSELITMGDGSNDIPMLEAAGLSIAWHAKPKVRPHAKQAFDFAPLSGVLALFD